jgi:fumarate reductase flavoprotein subunit
MPAAGPGSERGDPVSPDCVVIGGGLAGMAAARRLQQLGGEALVLEQGESDYGHNNARISGGLVHLAWRAMDEDESTLKEHLLSETDGEIDPEVADALAANARRAIEWLAAEGVELRPKGDKPYQRHALYPHRPGTGYRIGPDFGPDRMMRALYDAFRREGGRVLLGAAAHRIDPGPSGRWTVAFREDGAQRTAEAGAVVVADGGFQGNAEMLARYVGPNASLSVLRAWPSSVGSGLRALLAVGAGTAGLGRVYGHMVSRDAMTNDTLWPYPAMDKLCLVGLLVDRRGDRFASRAETGVEQVTLLARSEDPRGYTVLFDDDLWQTAGRDNPYNTAVPNPDLVDRGGHLASSTDLAALAASLEVDPGRLAAAVAEHNGAPGATPIAAPPYHAARVAPGITFTMGGARIDGKARVLDVRGRPLPNVYAAGSAVGGVHGGPRGGYVGGLAVALELGLIAAEDIALRR